MQDSQVNRPKKRIRLRIDRIIICLLIIAIIVVGVILLFIKKEENKFIEWDMFVASATNSIDLYDENYMVTDEAIRGSKVTILSDKEIYLDDEYYKIRYNDKAYRIKINDLVETKDETVLEQELYVRTPVTVYENFSDSTISSFIKKGSKLEIIGFDKINDDGTINMYKVKTDTATGYVFSKYLVDNYDDSIKNYDEEVTYAYHKDRKFSYNLYGGSAANLDYYPYEKPQFLNNVMPEVANSLYLNSWPGTLNSVDKYIELAKDSGINTFVVDIKDGALGYKSEVAKVYSPTSYKYGGYEIDKYAEIIQKIKDNGFYVVGRIVVFNDPQFAADNPEECIKTNTGSKTSWVSAYSRKAWQYNVELSIEAIKLFGFNEIQFDYVRFPEASYSWSKNNYDYRNNYDEEKAQAIQNFLLYATDQIHKYDVYLSADVFGESSYTYVSAYGQYWPAISNVVDAISGMPYTDHFTPHSDAYSNYWTNPYNTVYNWALTAAARQKEIPTPAKARTWITAYNTPHWNPTVVYGEQKIYDQIKALNDAGLTNGCITWNGASSYSKYESIIGAFGRDL